MHFTSGNFNTFIFTNTFTKFPCRSMIDPAQKPVSAPPMKPAVKPVATHGLIKRARLVFPMFFCFNTSMDRNTVSP